MPGNDNIDAIVLADDPLAAVRIAGLTVRERAVRVARRAGATRVFVVDRPAQRAELAAWVTAGTLLVIRANQLVHTPLVQGLAAATTTAIAVVPDAPLADDLAPGSYAGAFVVRGDTTATARALATRSDADAAASLVDAARVPHGAVARAPIGTADERRTAARILYRILIKPQDNAITRYLYRPVSFPLTRLLAMTPISPNQVSCLVGVLVAIGCFLTADASHLRVFAGTATILAASYLDCCDGEIARVKLLSSKIGAWLDTIIDELSSIGYMAALGYHCHLAYGPDYLGHLGFDPWLYAVAIGLVTYGASIYFVYYNIIVAVGSANSQDYVGRFEIAPGTQPGTVKLVAASTKVIGPKRELPQPLQFLATYAPYIVRRDFIAWGATVLAALSLTQISFGLQALGGLGTVVILVGDHVRLRVLRRSVARAGQRLEPPSR